MIKVAHTMLCDPYGRHYGYDLRKGAHVLSGTLYPLLRRMLADGWLTDGWEDPAVTVGRPPRRYYQLTDAGRAALAEMLNKEE